MAHNITEYITRLELAHETGCWILKHVSPVDKQEGDIQINDDNTNALIYLRRISLEEAKQIVSNKMEQPTGTNESLGIVILPIESKIVQAIKRQKKYGN